MATFLLEMRNYKDKQGLCPIILRISIGDFISRKATGIKVKPENWDKAAQKVKKGDDNAVNYNNALDTILKQAQRTHADLITEGNLISASAVSAKTFSNYSFLQVAEIKIKEFEKAGSWGTAQRYRSVFKKLQAFKANTDFADITPMFLHKFKDFIEAEPYNNNHNTILANFNCLKSTWQKAVDLDVIPEGRNPFKRMKLGGFKKGDKNTLTQKEIEKYRSADLDGWQAKARDMFIFSYYTAGMRFGDVLLLRWNNIKDDRIYYGTAKNEKRMSIPLNVHSLAILDKYRTNLSTVFGVITETDRKKQVQQIRQKQSLINKFLQLGLFTAKIHKKISFHCARHSFSNIANEVSGRDVYGIKSALGHSSIVMTENYLGDDNRAVDDLLKKVYG